MAEKNTESTAVNELIELVATQKPLPPDPSEDLMFTAAPRQSPRSTKQMSPARPVRTGPAMTAVPPIRGAGEVAPLPRSRAPVGTQQGLQTIKMPPPPKVRISTAPPSRKVTIPPVAQVAPLTLDEENEVTNPEHDVMSRVTKPTLPPPLPQAMTMRGLGSTASRPSIPTTSFDYPVVKHPALELPVVAPPIEAPLVLENELVTSMSTTNPSLSKFEVNNSTHQVPKAGDWKTIVGKLIAPMVVLVIVGIFVGGYFAFDGDGGKSTPRAEDPAKVTLQAAAAGDVAKTGEPKSEPVKVEEPKAEPAAEPVAAAKAAEPTNVEEPKSEPAKTEPAKSEPAKSEPAKTEPANTEPAPAEPAMAKTAVAKPALVDIRVDSNPSGATVNLIDRGKSMYLGTTPLSAAVDASRKYELVFSYENRATLVEALDPSTQKRVSVKLSRVHSHGSSSAKAELPTVETAKVEAKESPKAEEPKRGRRHRSKSEPKSGFDAALAGALESPKTDAPKTEAPKAEDRPKTEEKPAKAEAAAKADAGGEGTLMISSKPPCEIIIDGKPTGLTTPQRSIALPAGAHKITLVNSAEGIKKTVSVQITADKPTKVIQDFMK